MRFLLLLLLSSALVSCGGVIGGQFQENLKRLDEVHGYCDNPARGLKKGSLRYKICKDKERAGGADGIVEDEFNLPFSDILNREKDSNGKFIMSYNKHLWDGSLDVLSKFPLKIVDSQGGYLETEYIYDENLNDKRCVIKVKVTSTELISTGVSTNIVCQNKENNNWIGDNQDYLSEAKQITLSILEKATSYKITDK